VTKPCLARNISCIAYAGPIADADLHADVDADTKLNIC
jgi:hypothetical protein